MQPTNSPKLQSIFILGSYAFATAAYEKLAAYKKRMGWGFKWVSSGGTDFNFDYHVSFTPEEVAKKQAFFNTTPSRTRAMSNEKDTGFSIRMSAGMFSTATRVIRAAMKSSISMVLLRSWFLRSS
jgi:predicted dithiol-disulfide oxidoreductase (DUF899 family)